MTCLFPPSPCTLPSQNITPYPILAIKARQIYDRCAHPPVSPTLNSSSHSLPRACSVSGVTVMFLTEHISRCSRGNPTVEVDLTTAKGTFRAAVPSGASTGVRAPLPRFCFATDP